MGFSETVTDFLKLASKKDLEELRKENDSLKDKVATQEILIRNAEDEASPATFASTIARETQERKDVQGVVLKRIPIKDLQLLYLNNQFVFRGVNVRADELVSRGYEIVGSDAKGVKLCQELIKNSGDINLFWQLSVNTDVAGDGYLEKVPNEKGNKILLLKHINPINFGFETEENDRNTIKLDASGNPVGYQQVVIDPNGKEVIKKVSKDKIVHLRFNTFGDEFNGISSLQSVYNTALRLMNMEHAAAEAAVKTANPTWIVYTTTKSPRDLNTWTQVLGRISSKEVVFVPDGMKVELKSPGGQNFNEYADYFLDAVVAALGVPKSILTGSSDSGGGNRSTVQTLSQHFYSVLRANQRYVEQMFNEIFKEYGEMAGFEPPVLMFNDIAEDADRNGMRAVDLYANNLITLEEAREMIGLETDEKVKAELTEKALASTTKTKQSAIDPNKEEKKQDMTAWHPATPGSPAGSQKGEKSKKKADPNVPSVQ